MAEMILPMFIYAFGLIIAYVRFDIVYPTSDFLVKSSAKSTTFNCLL